VTASQIIATLSQNAENAQRVLRAAVRTLPAATKLQVRRGAAACAGDDMKLVPAATKKRLAPSSRLPFLGELVSLLVVGSVAFDALEESVRKVDRALGARRRFCCGSEFFHACKPGGIVETTSRK